MQRLERRLAAVLAIDTAGYSRMMEADVEGTHRRVTGLMLGIVEPAIAAGGGRIVKKTGDGALVEFPSVSEALRAAQHIQRQAIAAEAGQPTDRQVRFRIGINLGDVIVEPDDIYGDGVNIAARLEGLAQPGDVIVSESAMQTVDRAGYAFVDLGVQHLKNISRPIRVFRVIVAEGASGRMAASASDTLVPGFGTRPAIAVLPFRYSGPDAAEQEHFADGVTEDIIAALSRWRFFPVIARGSVFTFKGRDVDPVVVGQQLGARYILEGSLRRQGSRVRSGVGLVDADTRETLLTEQYQYDIDDMFTMQDEIVRTSIGVLEPELLKHEHQRALRTPPQSANAYELFLRGQWHHYRYTREDNTKARALLRNALEIAPAYAHASAGLALTLTFAATTGWIEDKEEAYDEAIVRARNAVHTDPRDPMGHFALAGVMQYADSPRQEMLELLNEAVRLDPSYAGAHANIGFARNYMNQPELAIPAIELALRLSPTDRRRPLWLPGLSIAHYLAGRYREALAVTEETLAIKPDLPVPLRYLLATLGQLGRTKDAQAILPLVHRLDGGLRGTETYLRRLYEDAPLERIMDGLRKAGLS